MGDRKWRPAARSTAYIVDNLRWHRASVKAGGRRNDVACDVEFESSGCPVSHEAHPPTRGPAPQARSRNRLWGERLVATVQDRAPGDVRVVQCPGVIEAVHLGQGHRRVLLGNHSSLLIAKGRTAFERQSESPRPDDVQPTAVGRDEPQLVAVSQRIAVEGPDNRVDRT